MIRLTNASRLPPGGVWSYFDEDLGVLFEHAGMLEDLPRVVNARRIEAKISPTAEAELSQRILQYICDHAPAGYCRGHTRKETVKRALTVSSITNFTRTLVALTLTKMRGRPIHNPNPNKAAEICEKCPLNRREFCSTCTGLELLARKVLRQSQTTPRDKVLGACEACGCMLRVKVHYNPEVLRDAVSKSDAPRYPKDTCWIWNEELLK